MSLETLVNGYKAVDQAVLKQYTRLGQHIPEEKLYKVTTGLSLVGVVGGLTSLTYYIDNFFGAPTSYFVAVISTSFPMGLSFSGDLLGLLGHPLEPKSTDSVKVVNPVHKIISTVIQKSRLPYLTISVGFLGMLGYDVAQDVIYDHFIPAVDYVKDAFGAVGFFSSASSMYLKDQDPKLLEKKPSRVKAFFIGLYEKMKGTPSPVPVPVAGYSVLEHSLSK